MGCVVFVAAQKERTRRPLNGTDETSVPPITPKTTRTNHTTNRSQSRHHAASCGHTVVVTWTGELPLQMHRDRLGMSGVSNEYGS